MRFISNKVRDAFFAQRRPENLKFEDETDDAGQKFTAMLTDEQIVALADYMCFLCRLRQEEQEWYFQRGWLAREKDSKAGNTP